MLEEKVYPIQNLSIPSLLKEIPDAPKKLYIRGSFPDEKKYKFLSVVGSRKYSAYAKEVCESLIQGLRGYPIVIISGLALGIDGIAHKSALASSLTTIAVPGSGLDDSVLYPATHRNLAREILESDGALVSEFAPTWRPRPESFPQRNRIMAGLSHAVLVIEAEYKSGTLITSRLATEYNRDVFTVPGSIFSSGSSGPHMLLQKGAALIHHSKDILDAFHLSKDDLSTQIKLPLDLSPSEQNVCLALSQPLPRDELVRKLDMSISEANILLSSLEIKGYITERLGKMEWKRS